MLISNYWYLLKDTIYSPLFALYVSLVCQGGEIMIRKVKYKRGRLEYFFCG